jgi:membrane-associated phospholipid phosphatase
MSFVIRLWLVMVPLILCGVLYLDRTLSTFLFKKGIPTNLLSWTRELLHLPASTPSSLHPSLMELDVVPLITACAPILLLAVALMRPGRLRDLMMLGGVSVLVAFVLKNDLKWFFHRDWPFLWAADHSRWYLNPADGFHFLAGRFSLMDDGTGAFPSGHSAVAFAFLTPVMMIFPRSRPWCLLAGCGLGALMVLLCFHYLGDVLAGALLGVTCAFAVREILRPLMGLQGPRCVE